MKKNDKKGHMGSLEKTAAYWDTHSLSDIWNQTKPVTMSIAPDARRRYLVPVDRDVLGRVSKIARRRGLSTESLVNLLIEQRITTLERRRSHA